MKKHHLVFVFIFFTSVVQSQTDSLYFGVNLSGAEWGKDFPGVYNQNYFYPNANETIGVERAKPFADTCFLYTPIFIEEPKDTCSNSSGANK